MAFNIDLIRKDFPLLNRTIYNKPLVYLDNGATTQKPAPVIECVNSFHTFRNSSIHRGVHYLAEQATEDFENARKTVQHFINARNSHEIIFTAGTTSAINGIAFSFGERYIKPEDEIIITEMEHHANIVPWQMLCERKNAVLRVVPFTDDGVLDTEYLKNLISEKTKLLAVTYVSNALGTVNPLEEIISLMHRHNIPVLVDAAQSVQHIQTDVQKLGCDFFIFSGHKVYGPTGIGILYAAEKWLEEMPPFSYGGEMVDTVTFEKTTWNTLPFKFEAGTPNYIGAVGLAEALKYISDIGLDNIRSHEQQVLDYGTRRLLDLGYITIYGKAAHKSSILSFAIRDVHPYDAGMVIDKMGIAVRTGTHCAQPVMQHYHIPGTIRASIAMYNTKEEIDILVNAVIRVREMFGRK
jgi:cysteine desulfurase/selenocysteine lyase